jgi:hypothetical protein
MQWTRGAAALAFLAIGACGQRVANEAATTANEAMNPAAEGQRAPPAPPPSSKAASEAKPQAQPTIDPKSPEAAKAVVDDFARLLNGRQFDEAYMLLGPRAPSRAQFDDRFAAYSDLKVDTGAPGEPEGAAGSIYIEVPLTISGTAKSGQHVQRSASAVLRRVNDVPGSTEAQRHWHIERIDWKGGA